MPLPWPWPGARKCWGIWSLRPRHFSRQWLPNRKTPWSCVGRPSFLGATTSRARPPSNYQRILKVGQGQTPAALARTRRALAMALVECGSYQDFLAARQIMQNISTDKDEVLADQRVRARVEASGTFSRPEAIQAFEALLRKKNADGPQSRFAEDWYCLAWLYEAEDNWKEASIAYEEATAANKNNALYARYYLRGQIRHGEKPDATVLSRLITTHAETLEAAAVKAHLWIAEGKTDRAVEEVMTYSSKSWVPRNWRPSAACRARAFWKNSSGNLLFSPKGAKKTRTFLKKPRKQRNSC